MLWPGEAQTLTLGAKTVPLSLTECRCFGSGEMGLLHQPNVTQWSHGDLVIHDADAKRADMLMIVLGQDATGAFRTRYAFPWAQPRPWRRKC